MAMKSTMVLLIIFGAAMTLYGQNSNYERLLPFDDKQYKDLLEEYSIIKSDSLQVRQGSIVLKDKKKYSIRLIEIHEENMAKMPNMTIKKDTRYSMLIKKYDSQYPYINTPKKDSLSNNGELIKPMQKPEE